MKNEFRTGKILCMFKLCAKFVPIKAKGGRLKVNGGTGCGMGIRLLLRRTLVRSDCSLLKTLIA
jgi:hypothetical protein